MEKKKKEQLEARGWVSTSVQDFLGLSPAESSYIELKLFLSTYLRNKRRDAEITQKVFAEMVGSSQSRISKMEAGDPTVSIDLLVRSLFALGLSLKELGYLIFTSDIVSYFEDGILTKNLPKTYSLQKDPDLPLGFATIRNAETLEDLLKERIGKDASTWSAKFLSALVIQGVEFSPPYISAVEFLESIQGTVGEETEDEAIIAGIIDAGG